MAVAGLSGHDAAGRTVTYDEVKDEMMQQATLEGLERARRQWLDELRRGVYVDVRL